MKGLEFSLEAQFLHSPNSQEYREAFSRLGRAFASVWELTSVLMLDVTEKGLVCGGTTLHPEPRDPGNLARTLHAGRVVSLTFSPGAEGSEVVSMLNMVQRARALKPDDDDDLRTLLWGLDLYFIQYTAEEQPVVEDLPAEPPSPSPPADETSEQSVEQSAERSAERKARIREEAAAPDRRARVVDVEEFDSTLYFLEQREIEYLQEGIELEYLQDLGRNLVSLLLDILETRQEAEIRFEVIGVLGQLLPHLLGDGSFGAASYLLSEVEELMQDRNMVAAERKALDALAANLSRPGALAQLLQFLQDAETPPSADDLGRLLAHLRPEALTTILRWVKAVSNPRAAATLSDAVEHMAREQPLAVAHALASDDRAVLERALPLVEKLRPKESIKPLCNVGAHPEASIRAAAAEVMGILGGSKCCGQLTRMIDDDDSAVRVTALRALTLRRHAPALKRIEELINEDRLLERDLAEQRVIFEAYGSLAGNDGFTVLDPLLRGKKGVGRKDPDIRACAAIALGRIGTPEARMALQAAERDKDPVVRIAAGRALRDPE